LRRNWENEIRILVAEVLPGDVGGSYYGSRSQLYAKEGEEEKAL
jgi:hypothetical protein